MPASNGNVGLVLVVGFAMVVIGLALVGLAGGPSGSALVFGGVLLIIVAVALTRPVPDTLRT